LKIREATMEDCYDMWIWRNRPAVRKWCFDAKKISYKSHKEWFGKAHNDKYVRIYIVENVKKEKIGTVRFKIKINRQNCAYLSVYLNSLFLGKGFGHRIVKKATDFFLKEKEGVTHIIAEVFEDNIASQRVFEKASYVLVKRMTKQNKKIKVFMYERGYGFGY